MWKIDMKKTKNTKEDLNEEAHYGLDTTQHYTDVNSQSMNIINVKKYI